MSFYNKSQISPILPLPTEIPESPGLLDVAFRDVDNFINRFYGELYKPRNNFSFRQKSLILSYLFHKNSFEMAHPKQKYYKITKLTDSLQKDEINEYLGHLTQLDSYNRVFLVSAMGESLNTLAKTGYILGTLLSGCLWVTIFRNVGYVKKIPIILTLIHLSGQYAYYRNLDRTFDALYPFFQIDLKEYYKEKKEREEILSVASDLKALDQLIDKSLKEEK